MGPHAVMDMPDAVHIEGVKQDFFAHSVPLRAGNAPFNR